MRLRMHAQSLSRAIIEEDVMVKYLDDGKGLSRMERLREAFKLAFGKSEKDDHVKTGFAIKLGRRTFLPIIRRSTSIDLGHGEGRVKIVHKDKLSPEDIINIEDSHRDLRQSLDNAVIESRNAVHVREVLKSDETPSFSQGTLRALEAFKIDKNNITIEDVSKLESGANDVYSARFRHSITNGYLRGSNGGLPRATKGAEHNRLDSFAEADRASVIGASRQVKTTVEVLGDGERSNAALLKAVAANSAGVESYKLRGLRPRLRERDRGR